MLMLVLNILMAIAWTAFAIKAPIEDSKSMIIVCAVLWWAYTILNILKFIN
jgi:hypothetical protein